ncbi:MAG: hypothetical protein B6I28_03335 [Fusobacteriia bacterium 4572_132]|nr:MAG: hypothetical protein B6I28_03335 [Fusobacteriia bacterium 4572_132]
MDLVQMSMLGEEPKEEKKVTKATTPKKKKKKKKVKVYGNELFIASEEATNEQIREMVVGEYGYSELTKQIADFQTVEIEGNNDEEYLLISPSIPSHKKKG